MRVALYARVSKDEMSSSGQLQDTENQLGPLRQFAAAMGWEVVAEFVDRASGGGSDREGFQRMLGQVRQHRFDMVLVWRLDRFSREGVLNTISYVKQLRENRCALKSMQEPWCDTTQEGVADLILSVMAWAAGEERKKLKQNTKAALARKRALGVPIGRHPKDCGCGRKGHNGSVKPRLDDKGAFAGWEAARRGGD